MTTPHKDPFADYRAALERRAFTDLAVWFPVLRDAGVPVPRTEIVKTALPLSAWVLASPGEAEREMAAITAGLDGFIATLGLAARAVGGWPVFLRTGYTSHKHGWEDTCYVGAPSDLLSHVRALVEFSEMADLTGLPTDTWAVREYFPPAEYLLVLPKYANMPVAVERRLFIKDHKVVCEHPYWPLGALAKGGAGPSSIAAQRALEDDLWRVEGPSVVDMALRAAAAFGGWWSLDFMRRSTGQWVAIDMAMGADSWHWPGCPEGRES